MRRADSLLIPLPLAFGPLALPLFLLAGAALQLL